MGVWTPDAWTGRQESQARGATLNGAQVHIAFVCYYRKACGGKVQHEPRRHWDTSGGRELLQPCLSVTPLDLRNIMFNHSSWLYLS